jgi:hypothetical protein
LSACAGPYRWVVRLPYAGYYVPGVPFPVGRIASFGLTMQSLNQTWLLDGLHRVAAVSFRASSFTPGVRPPGATAHRFIAHLKWAMEFSTHFIIAPRGAPPHRYLSGAALSPPGCISRTLRPNGSSPACTGDGDFLPFHHCASWRTVKSPPAERRSGYRRLW